MSFKPGCLPAAVGSLPHLHPYDGVELVLKHLPEIPIWPQLPNRGYLESMYIQFSEGMPFLQFDPKKGRMHMNLSGDIYSRLERFYLHIIEEDLPYFAITPEHAMGLDAFIDWMWRRKPKSVQWIKGQVTGPISFGLMITDQRKRAVLYNEEVFDSVLKSLVMKARWQVQQLQRLHPHIIIFVDEPYLSSFGSAFINLTREQVLLYLGEVIEAVHQEGALAGVHCCGNTDWALVMETETDIVNFDACEYFQGMTLYIDELNAFLQRGGVLAWGIVPTSAQIEKETPESLTDNFYGKVSDLERRGVQRKALISQSLLTPSCGMGTMKHREAGMVLEKLSLTSQLVRNQISVRRRKKAV